MKESIKQITKICSKHLRTFSEEHGYKLKSTDAHELIASIFGYKSRAAMLADKNCPLSNLSNASLIVLTPSEPIDKRRADLQGLPSGLPDSNTLSEEIYVYLAQNKHIVAKKTWSFHDLKRQALLLAHEYQEQDQWNIFYLPPKEEDVNIEVKDSGIFITIIPFHNPIKSSDIQKDPSLKHKHIASSILTTIWLKRIAGHIGFAEPEINTRTIPMLYKQQA